MTTTPHPAAGWAATYRRVSLIRLDRDHQDSLETHERINRQAALTHGLKIKPGCEFDDKGISASKDVRRPGFERALQAVVDREVEALIVPALDRLSRRGMRHIGEVLDTVEAANGRIIFVREALDTSVPTSRAIIAFLAEQARSESQTLGSRITDWHESSRLQGRWTANRPYGHRVEEGKLVAIPEEAATIRRIAREFLNGATARGLAVALNKEGHLSPRAAKVRDWKTEGKETKERGDTLWHAASVTKVLRSPSLCGWGRHNNKLVLDADGEPVSYGEAIITPGERAMVLAELEHRSTDVTAAQHLPWVSNKRTGAGRPPKYLLSGVARCGSCGYAMSGTGQRGSYRCSSLLAGRGCPRGSASMMMTRADAEAVRQLTVRLAAMDLEAPDDKKMFLAIADRWRKFTMTGDQGERTELEGRLAYVRGRIADLDDARWVRGQFETPEDVERWDRMMARLKEQRSALWAARDKLGPPAEFQISFLLDPLQSREAWAALSVHEQRTLFMVAADRVLIYPDKGKHLPVNERVRAVLHGETGKDITPTPDERRQGTEYP